ncbi:39S ribosomal protein L15, mitochondrial-like [Pollicipes pollicipes]|uniref:39S ribosomal protein L15, mitochondrial-like n=1 Tax=Pollicipes pollicipes TaxID=41117 RepID=UPI001884E89A|nr:39S ribosomal protein L15, mitochondrial-like [Pollicipes pollicipes]
MAAKWLYGVPIPRRALPPQDAVGFYTDPRTRGYLADPEQVARDRLTLAQKYGYEPVTVQEGVLTMRKDPRQVFFGLEPGWLVSLASKEVWRVKDPTMVEYYRA